MGLVVCGGNTDGRRSCVESSRLRNASSSEVRRPLIPKTANGQTSSNRSEMARMAGKIASDIQGTTLKLEKLAQRTCLLPRARD